MSLGPIALPDGQFVMRTPRLSDAAAWSAARLANREWLERAFPAWGDDWAAEQSETAWAQRWLRLRAAALRGKAMPFVLFVDGRLVGEIGVDAVDPISASGEASVWMVRDHGSAAVMNTASVLLLDYVFTCATPLDRLLSPVATSSRKGRSPGLSAVGLRIEGTIPRKVGDHGMVDHDMWVIHNTTESRAKLAGFVAAMPVGTEAPDAPAERPAAATLARALVREARGLRRASSAPAASVKDGVTLRLLTARTVLAAGPSGFGRAWRDRRHAPHGSTIHQIVSGDEVVGTVYTATDLGTGTHEITVAGTAGLATALELALAATPAGARPAVRVPLDTPDAPDEQTLRGLGLVPVATFAGNPEGRSGWPGEQRWEPSGQAS